MNAWETRPPGGTPSPQMIADQLDVLTALVKGNGLPSSLAVLKRQLEQNWQPDATVLLQAGSVVPALMSGVVDADGLGFKLGGINVRWGVTTLSFTASVNSAAKTVTHGMGKTPTSIVAMALNAAYGNLPNPLSNTLTTTTFDLLGEVKTAFTGSVSMMWVALG